MKSNKELFIEKSIIKHGKKYDYSLVEYVNNKTKVRIICPEHGVFEQRPDMHIRPNGCRVCVTNTKLTLEEFITRSVYKHGVKYDYTLVDYTNNKSKVKIICPEHGIFEQIARSHLNGSGCYECLPNFKYTEEEIINKFNEVHNNRYDYSLVEYKNSHQKVSIICKKHGIFKQKPFKHIQNQGCSTCKLSKGILKICNILDNNNINYEMEKSIEGCVSMSNVKLRFDIFIPDMNLYIEYDGEQHFRPVSGWGGDKSFNDVKIRDNIKNEFCKNNNIKLLRISYLDNIEEKIKDII